MWLGDNGGEDSVVRRSGVAKFRFLFLRRERKATRNGLIISPALVVRCLVRQLDSTTFE